MIDQYFMSKKINHQIDQSGKGDPRLFRSAFADTDTTFSFSDYVSIHGIENAMRKLKTVTYSWDSLNYPIGDMMGWRIYSAKASELIREMKTDFRVFEPIEIDGTPAFYLIPNFVQDISEELDFYFSKSYKKGVIVSKAFKDAWNSAALLGAEFSPINHEQLENK